MIPPVRQALTLLFLLPAALWLGPGAQTRAQVPPAQQAQARAQLEDLGVDEEELRRRLLARGIDVEQMTPQQLAANRATIEATVAELSAERDGDRQSGPNPQGGPGADTRPQFGRTPAITEPTASTEEELAGEEAAEAKREEARTEADSVAPPSTIYGHDLFRNRTLEVFRVDDQIRAPSTYILNEGDEIAVSIFGVSQADLLLEVGSDGFVRPPSQPRIYLEGRSLGDAREIVRERMSRYYVFEPGQFALTLSVARTVSVAIYGEVEAPGTYTLSALNSALNALVAAGGVTELGSVRAIEIQRDGQRLRTVDVYGFLENASLASELGLRDNDVIFVPQRRKIVTAAGGFVRAMRYELLRDEALADLVAFAGGFVQRAATDALKITRYAAGRLVVEEVDFGRAPNTALQEDDVITAPVVEQPIEEFVLVEGEVLLGGRYGYREGLTAVELLEKAGPRPTAREDLAFLERTGTDGATEIIRLDLRDRAGLAAMTLTRGDVLRVLPARRFRDAAEVTVTGAVRDSTRTFRFPENGGITLEEAILLAGGLTPDAQREAVITRESDRRDGRVTYRRVDLGAAGDTRLRPNDVVTVYTTGRIADDLTVSVQGAVRAPGTYQYDPAITVEDLIYLSGGLANAAQASNVDVYRLDISNGTEAKVLIREITVDEDGGTTPDFELQPFDRIVVRTVAEYGPIETVTVEGEVRYPGAYAKTENVRRISDILRLAGGVTEDAFAEGATLKRGDDVEAAVLTLDNILANPGGPADLVVLDGDIIRIPKPQELVHIDLTGTRGRRYAADSLRETNVLHVAYQGPQSARWYIERFAGGFDDETGKKPETVVVYADGQIQETNGFLTIRNYPIVAPGATVLPGYKAPRPPKPPRDRTSWGDLAQGTLALLSTVVTMFLLIRQVD